MDNQRTFCEIVLRHVEPGEVGDFTLTWLEQVTHDEMTFHWERHLRPLTREQAKPLIGADMADPALRAALFYKPGEWCIRMKNPGGDYRPRTIHHALTLGPLELL